MIRLLRRARLTGVLFASLASHYVAQQPPTDPLTGYWELNVARSHYGGGAEPRTRESFVCVAHKSGLNCTIESTYTDGRRVSGGFTASYGGAAGPTRGISDVDHVRLAKISDTIADATFSKDGKPVYAYRAVRSAKGHVLTITSVNPATRAVLNSVIVYDRR